MVDSELGQEGEGGSKFFEKFSLCGAKPPFSYKIHPSFIKLIFLDLCGGMDPSLLGFTTRYRAVWMYQLGQINSTWIERVQISIYEWIFTAFSLLVPIGTKARIPKHHKFRNPKCNFSKLISHVHFFLITDFPNWQFCKNTNFDLFFLFLISIVGSWV